jgi:hypothetical protein
MPNPLQPSDMAHVIQLSVAPVFLISGIGALLSVLSTRVGRIVDRSRQLEDKLAVAAESTHASLLRELYILSRRVHFASWAISLCTVCALLICALIVMLFVGVFIELDVSTVIALLFISAMSALITGLICFLCEIHLAIASLHIRQHPPKA